MRSDNHRRRPQDRRGVLLLIVLSMLTLFLLLGTTYLVVSTRSRVTARAFNRLVMRSDEIRIPSAQMLDSTLLYVLRGGTRSDTSIDYPRFVPSTVNSNTAAPFESLLEDKYGRNATLTGTAQSVTRTSGSSCLLTLTGVALTSSTSGTAVPPPFPPYAAELPGRVLTLCPENAPPTSHRILQAVGTGPAFGSITIDAPSTDTLLRLPKGQCRVVVNGREFDGQATTNEAWDGFDSSNPFLARIEASGSVVSSGSMGRMSFALATSSTSHPEAFDCDNDGEKDSLFLDFNLPSIPTASGTVKLDAAVLVVDLDSRFNVNAHGSLAQRIYPAGPAWPTVTGTNLSSVPLGSGYGPPEVSASWMYPQDGSSGYPQDRKSQGEDNTLWLMAGSGTGVTGRRPTGSRFTASGSTPQLQSLQGRYGEDIRFAWGNYRLATAVSGDPLPGRATDDDVISRVTDQQQPPTYNKTWSVSGTNTAGIPSLWWTGSNGFNWAAANARTSFNSPPDLHGRMKTVALPRGPQGITPRVAYAKVEWGDRETVDDPYELVLGPSAPSNGWMADPNTSGTMPVYDNIYSFAELEPVLRPYDVDTFRLPLRLAAQLGSLAEESRLRVTTASWDTTAITGSTAARLSQWIRTTSTTATFVTGTASAVAGTLGGEVARGEKFNLNRPLTNLKPTQYSATHPYYVQRQAYFKDLYTLVWALMDPSGTTPTPIAIEKAKEYAQWAANVVEFRDADSTMTPFEYDSNPTDGWTVDGNAQTSTGEADRELMWGVERPEILIMETSAWEDSNTGELFIVLHRPWNADAVSTSGTVAAEPCDAALDLAGTPANRVDLGRPSGTSSYPIWRLRIDDGAGNSKFVRLDETNSNSDFSSSSVSTPASTPKMAADSWLCIYGNNSLGASISASGTVVIDKGGAFRVPGDPLAPGTNRSATVFLERLTDPSAGATATTWTSASGTNVPHYHVVDSAPIDVVNRSPLPPPLPTPPPSVIKRSLQVASQSPWRTATASPIPLDDLGPAAFAGLPNDSQWFPWPNRPFISAAELCLVPWIDNTTNSNIISGSNALGMLNCYTAVNSSSNSLVTMHSGTNPLWLLDAVHVPTRFAGIHRTVTSGTGDLTKAGIHTVTTPVNQLSSFREPGRMNLNTVMADDVWNSVIAGPLAEPTDAGKPAPLRGRTVPSGTNSRGGYSVIPGGSPADLVADLVTVPAQTLGSLLALQGTVTGTSTSQQASPAPGFAADTHPALVASGSFNPAHLLYTANRLANTATVRSNVFAIWITLRESIANDPDSVKYHRAFYIVDRSVPVAHEPGKDHNVWDAVVLRRIIE